MDEYLEMYAPNRKRLVTLDIKMFKHIWFRVCISVFAVWIYVNYEQVRARYQGS